MDTLQFVQDVITVKFENAKKENDFVYHLSVPAFDKLPVIQGTMLLSRIISRSLK